MGGIRHFGTSLNFVFSIIQSLSHRFVSKFGMLRIDIELSIKTKPDFF